jgi:hypothetical protein
MSHTKKKILSCPPCDTWECRAALIFVRVSLSNFILLWMQNVTHKKNLPTIWMRGPYSLVTESSFYVGRVSLSNFIGDGNLTFWCARALFVANREQQ